MYLNYAELKKKRPALVVGGANILMKIYMQWLAAEILMGCLKSTHMSIIMSPVWLETGVGRGGGCQFLAVLM